MRRIHLAVILVSYSFMSLLAQDTLKEVNPKAKILYGTASYYSNKFNGRKTANGEIFSQEKMTAACNVLPFGTWIKVTNLRNGKSVIVKTNDRLNASVKRVVDLSRSAAQQLQFLNSGLTKVKVEVIGMKKPEK